MCLFIVQVAGIRGTAQIVPFIVQVASVRGAAQTVPFIVQVACVRGAQTVLYIVQGARIMGSPRLYHAFLIWASMPRTHPDELVSCPLLVPVFIFIFWHPGSPCLRCALDAKLPLAPTVAH